MCFFKRWAWISLQEKLEGVTYTGRKAPFADQWIQSKLISQDLKMWLKWTNPCVWTQETPEIGVDRELCLPFTFSGVFQHAGECIEKHS